MRSFSTFLDRQDRDNKSHLEILKGLYEKAGFRVGDHLDDRKDPYLFIRKPEDRYPEMDSLTFQGIRIYCRGKDVVAYRCQNKESTEPFGEAYLLDVKGMYKSLMKEGVKSKKVGKKLIKFLIEEILDFFLQSVEIEKTYEPDGDNYGIAVSGSTGGTDYGTSVLTPGIGSSAGR